MIPALHAAMVSAGFEMRNIGAKIGQAGGKHPRLYTPNWFRKGPDGKFIWPGFGDNMRVLKWIVDRCEGRAHAVETAIGWVPDYADIEWKGLGSFTAQQFQAVTSFSKEDWALELASHDELFASLKPRVPAALESRLNALKQSMVG